MLPENIVVVTHAVPFLRKQVKYEDVRADLTDELKQWLALTRKVSRDFGLRFVPRVHLNVRMPIRKLLKHVLAKPDDDEWHDVVAEIWKSGETWERIFRSPLEEDDDED